MVVGSIGIDTIETPYGRAENVLGGSAVYAALAASRVLGSRTKSGDSNILLISVVGNDFSARHRNFLRQQKIALNGLVAVDAPTLRWRGRYEFDMGAAQTLKTELGSLALAEQVVSGYQRILKGSHTFHTSEVCKDGGFLLLANLDPDAQAEIALQFRELKVTGSKFKTKFIVLDTMNYWIEHKKSSVEQAMGHVDCVVLNENEARQFFATPNLVKAGHQALELGPEYIIVKKGEHGSMLFSEHGFFAVPGYPLLEPIDPTGAGDSFAGALAGYLARGGKVTFAQMRKATVYATAISSFTVEGMATSRLASLKSKEIEERVKIFQQMRKF